MGDTVEVRVSYSTALNDTQVMDADWAAAIPIHTCCSFRMVDEDEPQSAVMAEARVATVALTASRMTPSVPIEGP